MLLLTRQGRDVFHNGVKLTIVKQASKGPNKEVVKIDGLEGSNGQKWVSLSLLNEGDNDLTNLKGREVTTSRKYQLTKDEQLEVDKLQTRIDEILEVAKSRYVPRPNFNLDISKLSKEERDKHIKHVQRYLSTLKG